MLGGGDSRSLTAKRLDSTMFHRPGNLEIRHTESTQSTGQVDQGADLPLLLREAVVAISVNRDGVDHDGQLCDAPAHYERAWAQVLLERCAEDEKSADV